MSSSDDAAMKQQMSEISRQILTSLSSLSTVAVKKSVSNAPISPEFGCCGTFGTLTECFGTFGSWGGEKVKEERS